MKKALIQGTRICEFGEEFPVHKDLQWVDVPDDTTDRDTYVDGAVVKEPDPTPLTWEEARRDAYPPLGDQLDMLWHAIDTGNWTAAKVKTTDFYAELKAVKADNPKPEGA